MSELTQQVAVTLRLMTPQAGYPFLRSVEILPDAESVTRWEGGANDVALFEDVEGSCGVFLSAVPGGEKHQAVLRQAITQLLGERYQVDAAGPQLPILVCDPNLMEKHSDAIDETTTDRGRGGSNGGDGGNAGRD